MMSSKNAVLVWEITGFIFINVVGTLLHFVFVWFGRWRPLALIAAVNESTWEHLKIAFWPALCFALVEYRYLRRGTNNFMLAKTVSLYTMPVLIILLFYAYLWIIGHDVLLLDILIFVVAIGIGQMVSFRVLTSKSGSKLNGRAWTLLLILTLAFLLFTFSPPHMVLFKDPITGGYGIVVP